ncbi:MAG: type II toxin-antitoxin system VapC family toxin [bacterium]
MLDTDILSMIMRQNQVVVLEAGRYIDQYSRFNFSLITKYEILRGLRAKGALKQVKAFDLFCSRNSILPVNDTVVGKAAGIYADPSKKGNLICDADILIAATALVNKLSLVTNNQAHFKRINELHVVNWLK